MNAEVLARRDDLLGLTKRDPDAQVRHRAHALLALVDSGSVKAVIGHLDVSVRSLRRWQQRFLAEGRDGLADRPRLGRPPKLPPEARTLLGEALEADPGMYGYPVATWTIADLTDLLSRRGWTVSAVTVNRTVHALDYVHRRPRHDLRHRQDVEAVASAKRVLADLQKRGLIPQEDSNCSTSMNANFIPTPTWQKGGSDAASRVAAPPPEPTSG
jgi:transposase